MIFPSKSRFLRKKMPEKFFVPSDGTYVSANGMYVPYRGIYVPAGGMEKISAKNMTVSVADMHDGASHPCCLPV